MKLWLKFLRSCTHLNIKGIHTWKVQCNDFFPINFPDKHLDCEMRENGSQRSLHPGGMPFWLWMQYLEILI